MSRRLTVLLYGQRVADVVQDAHGRQRLIELAERLPAAVDAAAVAESRADDQLATRLVERVRALCETTVLSLSR